MTPGERYRQGVQASTWSEDPAQLAVIHILDRLHADLQAAEQQGLVSRWLDRLRGPVPVRGLYVWGGVGRGKTFLVDLLHDALPGTRKLRLHFHRFMGRVHAELRERAGERDPLAAIARRYASEIDLFCLDEFVVSDIGDAMILAEFLKHLFDAGATLVTTSNLPPHRLYEHGLQRDRFRPAIALIERHCQVHELVSATDYRLRALTQEKVYLFPNGADAERKLAEAFDRVNPGSERPEATMVIHDRPIPLKRRGDGIAWFEFSALCEGPRAVADYIELARSFNTVLISNVPRFGSRQADEDAAKRFIHLIDEFYDRRVNVVLSAAVEPMQLYSGERHQHEFQRTISRLIEMQSTAYLSEEHKP
ncbi:MAG: AFG1 family ATPase [Ahniella sp.]|nr:AFG1 family ATPase [Ahniella sp.]